MYSLSKFCVVCLNKKNQYHKIIRTNSDDAQLFHMLYTCEFMTDFLDINTSLHICNKCFDSLQNAYKFIYMCRRNTVVFRNYISQLKHVIASGMFETEREQMYDEPKINLTSNLTKEEVSISDEELEQCTVKKELFLDSVDVHFYESTQEEHNINEEEIDAIMNEEYTVTEEILPDSQYDCLNIKRHVHLKAVKSSTIHQKNVDVDCEVINSAELKKEKESSDEEEYISPEGEVEECTVKEEILLDTRDKYVAFKRELLPNLTSIEKATMITNEKIYQCTFCQKICSKANLLKAHMRIHAGERRYQCKVCEKKFKLTSKMKLHMKLHTGEKTNHCTVCEKSFIQVDYLRKHMRNHTEERKHECTVCEKKFIQIIDVRKHMVIHSEEKKHKCTFCEKRFTQASTMNIHMRIHTGERKYECSVCKKKFIQNSDMRKHKLIHTGEKTYQCTICDKRFSNASNLNAHMRVHTGEKRHECTLCEKRFTRAGSLRIHLRLHTKDKT